MSSYPLWWWGDLYKDSTTSTSCFEYDTKIHSGVRLQFWEVYFFAINLISTLTQSGSTCITKIDQLVIWYQVFL